MRAPARAFPRELEAEYQAARFAEYRPFALAVGVAAVALTLGLWLRDYADDPAGAHHTLQIRLLMASGVSVYVLALRLPIARALKLAAGYLAVLVIQFCVLAIWSRLAGGYVHGLAGYMYLYIVVPLVVLPFTFRESVVLLVLVGAVPNVQVALGMAPGFPVLSFNALVWPACAIAIFAQRQFDQLFRRVFLSQRELGRLATRDSLTGLLNRRAFIEAAEHACRVAHRYRQPLCALMLDIDHFKSVNDRHGHAAGDDLLLFLAAMLSLQLRSADLSGRIGGEEFAAVLPATDLREALLVAERVRQVVEKSPVQSDRARGPIRITVSVGVAMLSENSESLDALLQEADARLYQAKRAGRNRVAGPGIRGTIDAPQPEPASV